MMARQEAPLVSISIPTYNNAATIENTIQSVLRQTYDNLEINVLDDCSKDNTVELVESFGDARIKLYRNEHNLGMTGNWNRCLAVAHGEFVKLICADDLLDETAIEKEVTAMRENPTVNLVESDTRLVDIHGKKTGSFLRYRKAGVVDGKKVAKTSIIWNNFFGAPVNNLIRKSTLDAVGGFDPDFTYILDFEMWMRIACVGDIYIIHELLNSFTVRNDSNTGNLIGKDRETYVDEHRRLVEKYKKELALNGFQCSFSVWFRKFRNVLIGIFLKWKA
jgi:glycosyltransferase involved in cell wall biosynthesis